MRDIEQRSPGGGRVSRLADVLPVALLRVDAQGACVECNPAGRQLLGVSVEQALGSGWLEALAGASRTEFLDRLRQPIPHGTHAAMELSLAPREGARHRVSCRVVPVPGLDGTDAGHLVLLQDCTERQETEVALRRTAQELEERVRELNCLFEVSRVVERLSGDLAGILRETVAILPASLRFPENAWACISLDGMSFESSGHGPTPRMVTVPITVHGERAGSIQVGYRPGTHPPHANPFSEEERNLLEAVAQRLGRTAERVKGRRLLQEREEEMRQRIAHLTRVSTMGEMASSIAHEVNQPLTAIATYAQACRRMLESGQSEISDAREVLGRIAAEALRAGDIIHGLKDMVRRQQTRWTECDVNALIRDLQQLVSVDARLHSVKLTFQLAPDLPPVMADGVQIQQVVLNLIRNGIDALEAVDPQSREVLVRTERNGAGEIRVSVRDNGCGLTEEATRNLFRAFFSTKKEGMGMGLSISRSIISAHRGRISFEPNPGPGATFSFTLPVLDFE